MANIAQGKHWHFCIRKNSYTHLHKHSKKIGDEINFFFLKHDIYVAVATNYDSFYNFYDAIMKFTIMVFNFGLQTMYHTFNTSNPLMSEKRRERKKRKLFIGHSMTELFVFLSVSNLTHAWTFDGGSQLRWWQCTTQNSPRLSVGFVFP